MAETTKKATLYAQSYINGEWVDGEGRTVEVISPINGETMGTFNACSVEQVKKAAEGAKKAQKEWGATPLIDRLAVLRRAVKIWRERAEEMAQTISREMGKTIREAREEMYEMGIPIFELVEGDAVRFRGETLPSTAVSSNTKKIMTTHVPIGVIGIITPWNFPVSISSETLPHALAMGNSVVYKPSEKTPFSTEMWVKILNEAGVPEGVVNMVQGEAEVGSTMTEHEDISAIAFTGSSAVGERIAKSAGLKRTLLEMGGKDPLVVMEDADIDEAVEGAMIGCYYNAGQVCTATERILVHETIHDEFVEKLVDRTKKIRLGNPLEEDTDMGPLSGENILENVRKHVEDAVAHGAELKYGGTYEGLYYRPTVLTNVTPDMTIGKEETFGPIAPVIKFSTREEAVEIANGTKYGLAASVYTSSMDNAFYMTDHIHSGMVYCNEDTNYWELLAPFGGVKNSGSGGRVLGKYALEDVTEMKQVVMEPTKAKKK